MPDEKATGEKEFTAEPACLLSYVGFDAPWAIAILDSNGGVAVMPVQKELMMGPKKASVPEITMDSLVLSLGETLICNRVREKRCLRELRTHQTQLELVRKVAEALGIDLDKAIKMAWKRWGIKREVDEELSPYLPE